MFDTFHSKTLIGKIWFILQFTLKMTFVPIWAIIEYIVPYTNTHPFYLTHQLFWHILPFSFMFFFYIFCPSENSSPNVKYLFIIWGLFAFFYPFVALEVFRILTNYKPVVQKMIHVILGLFGMIVSIWIMILCVISWQFGFFQMVSRAKRSE